jgi:hypothetical protein
LLQL